MEQTQIPVHRAAVSPSMHADRRHEVEAVIDTNLPLHLSCSSHKDSRQCTCTQHQRSTPLHSIIATVADNIQQKYCR